MNDKNFPFVSVIVPVLNGEGRIENCLDSLNAQNYPGDRFEIIVADGGSSDRTMDLAKESGAIVIDNPRRIQGAGKNEAMKIAKGELIAFSEDDIVVPPDWLSVGVAALQEHTNVIGVGGPTPLPDSASNFAQACNLVFLLAGGAGYTVQSSAGRAREVDDIPGGNALYRADALRRYLPIRENRTEDVDLSIRMKRGSERLLYEEKFSAWHYKKDNPAGFYRQIRRFGFGRLRLSKKLPEAIRPLHWVAALVLPSAVTMALLALLTGHAMQAVEGIILAVVGTFIIALVRAGSLNIALHFPLAVFLFFMAWSEGILGEFLFGESEKRG